MNKESPYVGTWEKYGVKDEDRVRMAPLRCYHQRRVLPPKQEVSGDFDHPKTLFVANESVWCKHRQLRTSLQNTYSFKGGSEENGFYAMLNVNRCLYLTSVTHAERFASPGTYF